PDSDCRFRNFTESAAGMKLAGRGLSPPVRNFTVPGTCEARLARRSPRRECSWSQTEISTPMRCTGESTRTRASEGDGCPRATDVRGRRGPVRAEGVDLRKCITWVYK